MKMKTQKQVRFLLSKWSPLKNAQKNILKNELTTGQVKVKPPVIKQAKPVKVKMPKVSVKTPRRMRVK